MGNGAQIRNYLYVDVIVFRMTTGEFGGLSNMAPDFPVAIGGTRIPTVEALYQACRFPNRPDIQAIIVDQPSPMTAKMKSKKYRPLTREDWDQRRVTIMRWVLRVKLAQNWRKFSAVLEKTGSKPIVEESRKDDFWGAKKLEDGTLSGMNVLGRLLMELREEYRNSPDLLKNVAIPNIPNFLFLGKPIVSISSDDNTVPSETIQSSFLSH